MPRKKESGGGLSREQIQSMKTPSEQEERILRQSSKEIDQLDSAIPLEDRLDVPLENKRVIYRMAAQENVQPDMLAQQLAMRNQGYFHYMRREQLGLLLQSLLENIHRWDVNELAPVLNGLVKSLDQVSYPSLTNVPFHREEKEGPSEEPFKAEGRIILYLANNLAAWILSERKSFGSSPEKITKFLDEAYDGFSKAKLWQECSAELNRQELSPRDFEFKKGKLVSPQQKKEVFESCEKEALELMKEVVQIVMASIERGAKPADKSDIQYAKYDTAGQVEDWFRLRGMDLQGELKGKAPTEYMETKAEIGAENKKLMEELVALRKQLEEQKNQSGTAMKEKEDALTAANLEKENLRSQLEGARNETQRIKDAVESLVEGLLSRSEKKGILDKRNVIPVEAMEEEFRNVGFHIEVKGE